jgi:glycosyltransferase involved in cell wall biosynthesis
MNQPLVSICVPTYNNARYLRQCLDSIVSQTYRNIEVIIADDGSTDDTVSIAREYVERYGFRLHRNETNKGAGETSSILVKMARGEYVAVYHSDDVYANTIVAESVAVLNNDASIGMVGTMANIINEDGNQIGEFRLHEALKSLGRSSFSFDEIMLGVLLNGGNDIILVTPSVMVRKSIYDELGGFNAVTYGVNYDYEMWIRVASRYRVTVIDARLMNYRIHKNQISQQQTRKNTELEKIVLVLRDYQAYISDNKLARMCSRLQDKWIFRTAKRQNDFGYYEKSNGTLKLIRSSRYLPLICMLRALNGMNISTKRRS